MYKLKLTDVYKQLKEQEVEPEQQYKIYCDMDILRSFAHEMIHHMQNLEGRLTDMPNTTNVNEDDRLKAIEEEAYTLGNMYFRS